MDFHVERREVCLPFGLGDGQGGRHRRAVITAMNGRAELFASGESDPFRAATSLLSHCLLRLGPLAGPSLDEAALDALVPLDRDYLLVQITRLSYGDVQFAATRCPAAACGERIDVRIDLSELQVERCPTSERLSVALAGGELLRVRLPRVADQVALHRRGGDDLAAELVRRLLLEPVERMTVDDEVVSAVLAALAEAGCNLDAELPLRCPHCDHEFIHGHDPLRELLRRTTRERRELLLEIHALAFHYHWSHAEILDLPRSLRHEYLGLLADALAAGEERT